MSEDLTVSPDPGHCSDVHALVARFIPAIEPALTWRFRLGPYAGSVFVTAYALVVAAYGHLSHAPFFPLAAAFVLIGVTGAEAMARVLHRRNIRRFRARVEENPSFLHAQIAARFRLEIEEQRARTLGPGSDWHRVLQPLQAARHEAKRSISYWRERSRQDVTDGLPLTQLATAERLAGKFDEAIQELDRRAHALVTFFNDCEAKLSVLEHSSRDIEESRRLAALSDQAEDLIGDAEAVLAGIGQRFLSEAIRLGEALGALERAHITDTARDVPLDQLESIADRIIESAAREHGALSRLMDHVSTSNPVAGGS